MMKKLLFTILCLAMLAPLGMQAQKEVYIPKSWAYDSSTQEYTEGGNSDLQWSFNRSKQSANCIIFWQKGFGSDPASLSDAALQFDPDAVLAVAEQCYALEVNTLGFNATNMTSRYKLLILMNYTTNWICYGGGYDFTCSALWLNPSTVHPAGSALAHEIGHSFHYMCYGQDSNNGTDASVQTGFHGAVGNGSTIWETTANWQSLASYPEEFFEMSGMFNIFKKSHNYAFTHEWQRYQAYPFFYYLCEKYNDVKTISQVWWQHETEVKDFNEVLMDCKHLSVSDLFRLHFEFAMRAVTWDLNPPSPYNVKNYLNNSYIGKYTYNYVKVGSKYQVAYSSVPQSTGFNVIPLNVPSAGTTVTTRFTALNPGCSIAQGDPGQYLNGESVYASVGRGSYNTVSNAAARGFRLGYVVLKDDGTRAYYDDNTIHCTGTGEKTEEISYTVPSGAKKMWLVVAPAPSAYFQHRWDEDITNDDQWPYQVEFVNTDLNESSDIDYDVTIDLNKDYNAGNFDGNYNPDGFTLGLDVFENKLGATLTSSNMCTYSHQFTSTGPSYGNWAVYPVKADGSIDYANHCTARGNTGQWYDSTSTAITADGNDANSRVGVVLEYNAPRWVIFQNFQNYPSSKLKEGDTFEAHVAIVLNQNGTNKVQKFNFNITVIDSNKAYNYTIAVADDAPAGAGFTTQNGLTGSAGAYSIQSVEINNANVNNYVIPNAVEGYTASISVTGSDIVITYTADVVETYTYTIAVAAGAPAGAGFTTQNGLTGSGNTYSIDGVQITSANVANYVIANAVAGYDSEVTVSGTTITVTYSEQAPEPVSEGETLNVERYNGLGYTTNSATVDFTAAKTFLGVSEVSTDMLRIVNPDGTLISDYAPYDGWFDADGVATSWGDNTKINVKFFQAITGGGTFTICDMNGADVVGSTYTVKWALVANDKTYTYTINITFAEKPDPSVVSYKVDAQPQTSDTSIYLTPSDDNFTLFSMTWAQVKSALQSFASSHSGRIGPDGNWFWPSSGNLFIAYADGSGNASSSGQAQKLTYGTNGFWFTTNDYEVAANESAGAYAIYLDYANDRWVVLQKAGALEAGHTYRANIAMVYVNNMSQQVKITFKFAITVTSPITSVTLKDTDTSYEHLSGDNYEVTLERSLPAGKWLTFCAPFNIYSNEFADMGIAKVMKLDDVTRSGESIMLHFVDADAIMVGIPVIIQMAEDRTSITKHNTGFEPCTNIHTQTVENGTLSASIIDTYVKIDLPNDIYYVQDDKFRHTAYTGTKKTAMKGFRAYFTVSDSGSAGVKSVRFNLGDDENVSPTSISEMQNVELRMKNYIYDLQGRLVGEMKNESNSYSSTGGEADILHSSLAPGIYIVDGRKVLIR